ncbi:MAG: hypothetical protein EZS28_004960 [Streblomastix strix]|uniref:MYND-type domain-containing protein n=1 Tax=Streblomastix strix TaxID=222440 RepID=A0A5J4WYG4_9EUKA|nr:MAG: hypothetical protein EZS28_004960 [Streblomastix strix]
MSEKLPATPCKGYPIGEETKQILTASQKKRLRKKNKKQLQKEEENHKKQDIDSDQDAEEEEERDKSKLTCAVCGKECSLRCSACKEVSYCCKQHQLDHWNTHKLRCNTLKRKTTSINEQIDQEVYDAGMQAFEPQMSLIGYNLKPFKPFILQDWDQFNYKRKLFKKLYASMFAKQVSFNIEVTQGLTNPLTIIHTMQLLNIQPKQGKDTPNLICIVGASEKQEEAGITAQNGYIRFYWGEIGRFYPGCFFNLVFIGPDLSRNSEQKSGQFFVSEQVNTIFVRSTFDEWCQKKLVKSSSNSEQDESANLPLLIMMPSPGLGFMSNPYNIDLIIKYNKCGITDTWEKTMIEIGKLNVPTVITMDNDEEFLESAQKYINERFINFFENFDIQLSLYYSTPPYQHNPFAAKKIYRNEAVADDIIQDGLNTESIWAVKNFEFTIVQGFNNLTDEHKTDSK